MNKSTSTNKNLAEALTAEAKSFNFKVKRISKKPSKALKMTKKAQKKGFGLLWAKVVAGVTLLASIGAYSFYILKSGKKIDLKKMKAETMKEIKKANDEAKKLLSRKIDLKKVKIEVLREVRKATDEAKKMDNEARKVASKR